MCIRDRCFWGTLLRFTGCTAFAHEEATSYAAGDDIALRRALAMVDFGRPSTFVARVVGGLSLIHISEPTRPY